MSRKSFQRHQDSLLTEEIEDDATNGNNNNNSIGTNTVGNFHQIHAPATGPGTVDNEMDNNNNTMRNRRSSGGMSNSSNSSNNRDNDNSNNGNNNNNDNISEYMPRMQRRRTTMITEQVSIEEINKPSIFTRIWDCSMPLFKGLIILIFIMLIIHNSSIMQEKTKEIRSLINSFETIKKNSIRVSTDNMELRKDIINCQKERIESETIVNELRGVITYHCGELSGTLEEAYQEIEYIYSEDHGPVNPEWLFNKNQREKEEDSEDNNRDDNNNNIDDSSKQDYYNDYIETYDINDDNNVLNERKNEINEDSERGHIKYENNDDIMDRIINSNQKENQENEYGRNNNNNNHNNDQPIGLNDASEIIVETNY